MMKPYPITESEPAKASTVRQGFKIDAPPCRGCGSILTPCAVDTGDGWAWGYECDTTECRLEGPDSHWWGDPADQSGAYPWPFVEEWARGSDWEAVGVRVV